MTLLTREQVIKAERFEMVEVDVTEWGAIDSETGKPEKTTVFVRELTAREKDDFEASLVQQRGRKQVTNLVDMRARMAVLVCCDESRLPIFRKEDVEWLTKKSSRPLTRIYKAATELNDLDSEGDIETLKN
ncbi:MAG: hypothetical protein LBL13_04005 [Bacteroidales bacterium]|jgi:hypothetical protein|nr:hypothetical protein [Bacteroidales bacterium]